MIKIEKLTEAERRCIVGVCGALPNPWGIKALRIIDQLTAALEAAEHDHHEQRESRKYWEQEESKTCARAEALQAEVTRLTAALEATEARADEERCERVQLEESDNYQAEGLREGNTFLSRELGRANARAEALQARVAELTAALKASNKDGVYEIGAHETTRLMLKRREAELADLRGRVEGLGTYMRTAYTDVWAVDETMRRLFEEALRGR